MKKIALIFAIGLGLVACNNDDDTQTLQNGTATLNFTHNWDGDNIDNADFDVIQYTNEFGTQMSISKLVYLISDVTFTPVDGSAALESTTYNLIDVRNNTNLNFSPIAELPEGDYNVSFTYGFDDEDNAENYPDLNSSDGSWAVPPPLGGGYHYMRLEGKYINTDSDEIGYQFHNVRANDMNETPIRLQDTSIEVNLGTVTVDGATVIDVEMNVSEWFKNPNTWNLNEDFEVLMPKFNIQIEMNQNGQNVFSLGTVSNTTII